MIICPRRGKVVLRSDIAWRPPGVHVEPGPWRGGIGVRIFFRDKHIPAPAPNPAHIGQIKIIDSIPTLMN